MDKVTYKELQGQIRSDNHIEIFKDIVGYEGLYQISNKGNVKSLRYGKKRILKPALNPHGYYRVSLTDNNIKEKTKSIHRLMAIAFIPNPENKPDVNHINGIKSDFTLNNLEWCTKSENLLHSFRVLGNKSVSGTKGKFGADSKMSKPVNQYDINFVFLKKWFGISEASRVIGIPSSNISGCCNLKRKTAGGYIWRLAN